MDAQSIRVIHGMSEVAGQGINSVKGLRHEGVFADMAVWRKNSAIYDIDIDLKIGKNKGLYLWYAAKMIWFAWQAWHRYNVLHSHYRYSLLPFGFDLKHNRRLNMKIFVEFHGTELRGIYHNIRYKYLGYYNEDINKSRRKQEINKLLKYADGVILHDVELKQHLPSNMENTIYIVPLRIDIDRFTPIYSTQNQKPVIVHAPSNRKVKGTNQILRELQKVKIDFELVLVEGMTHREALEIYKRADIIIDQISVGTYGVFALEGMALGKPVITYIDDSFREAFPDELPIVSAEFCDLAEKVTDLIVDPEKRIRIGQKSREYVERYHDRNKVAHYLKMIYDGTIENNNLFELL